MVTNIFVKTFIDAENDYRRNCIRLFLWLNPYIYVNIDGRVMANKYMVIITLFYNVRSDL
jgi:hypothetical protein